MTVQPTLFARQAWTFVAGLLLVVLVVALGRPLAEPVVWERWYVTGASLLAFLIASLGVRGTTGRVRVVRSWVALGLGAWAAGEVAYDVELALGGAGTPGVRDVVLPIVVFVTGVTLWSALRGRLSWREQVAVYFDGATVLFATAGVLIMLLGPTALGAPRSAMLLAYGVVILGIAGFALVLDVATLTERRLRGAYAVLIGLTMMGVSFLGKLASEPHADTGGWLDWDSVVALGLVLTGAGAATWSDRRDDSAGYRRFAHRLRGALPVVAGVVVIVARIVAAPGVDTLPSPARAAVDVCGGLVLLFALLRQTMLLADRDAAIAHEQAVLADLERSERRFRSLVQNSADIISVVSRDGRRSYVSPSVESVLGYAPAALIGRSISELLLADERERVRELIAEIARTPNAQRSFQTRVHDARGHVRTVEAVAKNLLEDPGIGGIVINWADITERKELEEQLEHRAFHDSLTGLANRALFRDRVKHAQARLVRAPSSLAVMFLDLDDFKLVNDGLGHAAGDELLKVMAQRLTGVIRSGDTAARLGGDEFAILLEDVDEQGAADAAVRIIDAVRQPVRLAGKDLVVHASIGIAFGDSRGQTVNDLLASADVAMYSAKSQGKGRYAVYEPEMHRSALLALDLRRELEVALTGDQFYLCYQPIVALGTRRVTGVEVLARWRNPLRGEIPPLEFIPIAEDSGLILPLGRRVLREACHQAAQWRRELGRHAPPHLSVNLSARQLQHADLIDEVREALTDSGLDAGSLVLEVTESTVVEDVDVSVLEGLKRLGVRLAIDDFGKGYSSLSSLSRLPFDIVKIDRSFTAGLGTRTDGQALIRLVVKLSQALGREVVAEGIESADQAAALHRLRCRFGQGFHFARPMEAGPMTELLRRWRGRAEPEAVGGARAATRRAG